MTRKTLTSYSELQALRRPSTPWPSPTMPEPTEEEVDEMIWLDGTCYAIDGCVVEPDGFCPHNMPSWLIYMDLI